MIDLFRHMTINIHHSRPMLIFAAGTHTQIKLQYNIHT